MEWFKCEERKPKQGDRVLLKIQYENCPVVGYWGVGAWEACCVNHETKCGTWCSGGEPDRNFEDKDVTHWAEITDIPADFNSYPEIVKS